MMLERRTLLLYTASIPFISICANAENTSLSWEFICKRWLELFFREENSLNEQRLSEVFKYFENLVKNKDFYEGFVGALLQSTKIKFPENKQELKKTMQLDQPISRFLVAFFELAMEAYYSSDAGYAELNLNQPPQPMGYTLVT